jgi:hypothetical protein
MGIPWDGTYNHPLQISLRNGHSHGCIQRALRSWTLLLTLRRCRSSLLVSEFDLSPDRVAATVFCGAHQSPSLSLDAFGRISYWSSDRLARSLVLFSELCGIAR